MSAILVTGASGNVGGAVVHALAARGARIVAAERRPERGAAVFGPSVRAVRLDFLDRRTWAPSLEGIRHMFLMRPPAIANVAATLNPFIDVARERGVDHIVFLSVTGADRNKLVPHRKVEDHLHRSGAHYTLLRPGFFAQNLESAYLDDIVHEDRIYVPAGHAPVNWIDVRDIAEVAALVLCEPTSHRGHAYTLTGPGPVPWSEVTGALSAALGRPIRYEPASVVGYMRHSSARGLPFGAILVQTVLHFLLRFGQGATFDPALQRMLGRPGRSVRAYVRDRAEVWARPMRRDR